MGVRRVRNEVSVEVERALLGTSFHTFRIDSFFPSPSDRLKGHIKGICIRDEDQ